MNTLHAEQLAEGWTVVDEDGGRWWPAPDVQALVQASEDPAAEVLRQYEADAPGTWRA